MATLRERLWIAGAAFLVLAALVGVGGAAARPGGVWLGVPGPVATLAVVLAVLALAAGAGGRRGLSACAGLVAPLLLVIGGAPLRGARAASGEPLLALALAGAVVGLAAAGRRTPGLFFLPAVFILHLVVAGRALVQVGPQGDEPHYLMVADSILRDGDLSLEEDYAAGRYLAFHDAPLAPHYRVRGRNGEIVSLHAIGLSLLILPAYAAAGPVGVSVFMALLAALLALEVREWARELTGRAGVADAVGWMVALCPPLIHFAGLVFTEVPAALLLAAGLRRGGNRDAGLWPALVVGLCAAGLPWLNVRYAPLGAIVVLHALWHRRGLRSAAALIGPVLVSAVCLALYHRWVYGFFDPRRVYGRRPEMSFSALGDGLPGLLMDQEFGLLVYAPVLAIAVPGLVAWWRRDRPGAAAAVLLILSTLLTAGSWHMWRGGFNPPGRFLVPVVPALAVAVAAAWARRGLNAGGAVLLGWSLWIGLAGGWEPRLVHRDRDGTAPFFREHSGALEWTGLLPGYVLADPGHGRLAALWSVALLLALPWRSRPPTPLRLAVAGLGWIAAAQAAAGVAGVRTDDRDAVRLVGRPAIGIPHLSFTPAAEASWDAGSLPWGPTYEPHRHPGGAEVGRRLPMPPGDYELWAEAELLAPELPLPWLETVPDHPGSPRFVRMELGGSPPGLGAPVEVFPGDTAVTLRLRGGGPLVARTWHLRFNPRGPGRSNGDGE